jgi:class 3 adenylate cyclase
VDETVFVEAGLYDPESPTAADRLATIHWLLAKGFTVEQMAAAALEGRLGALPVESLVAPGDGGLTLAAAADKIGLSPELVERSQRALGLPPIEGPLYSEQALGAFAGAVALFGAERTLQFSRVLGSSVARIIDAAVSLFVTDIAAGAASELELSRQGEDAAQLLLTLPETIEAVFPFFVADAVRRLRLDETPSVHGAEVAVGFVDLVGSTRLSQQLSGAELAAAVGDFETAASDLAVTYDGRVVKFIGDAAMFVASDAHAACAIGIELCVAVRDHPVLDAARGAVGLGAAVSQGGDFYGPIVNLAARLTGIASPGQLLGTATVAAAMADAGASFRLEPAGSHVLRGFADPVEAFTITRR